MSRSAVVDLPGFGLQPVSPFRFKPTPLLVSCLLLVVSGVAWRKGTYFSGGADPVVATKAALTLLAVAIAWFTPRSPDAWSRFRGAPVLWVAAYLTISVIGGTLNADGFSSLILAARLVLFGLALLLLTLSHPWQSVVSGIASAMLLVAVVGAATGIPSLAATGRLYGGIPPLNANEICLLVSVPVALLFWKCVYEHARRIEYFAMIPMLGVIWLTGARTGLLALLLAMMVMIVLAPRVPRLVAVGTAAAVPVVLYITFFTPIIAGYAGRGDAAEVTTLNSRTVAWSAAVEYANTLGETIFGSGLALKQIPVSATYRSEQILDSTWISALIQAGYAGVLVLLLFVLTTLIRGLRLSVAERGLVFSLTAMVTTSSVLESGMFDATPAFMIFFTMTLLAHRVPEPANSDQLELVPGR